MKKSVLLSISIICLSIMVIIFIHYSNDHSECKLIEETTVSEDGLTTVTTKKHSCNEAFNL